MVDISVNVVRPGGGRGRKGLTEEELRKLREEIARLKAEQARLRKEAEEGKAKEKQRLKANEAQIRATQRASGVQTEIGGREFRAKPGESEALFRAKFTPKLPELPEAAPLEGTAPPPRSVSAQIQVAQAQATKQAVQARAETEAVALQEEQDIRRGGFQEETGSAALAEELTGLIVEKPSLAPEPILPSPEERAEIQEKQRAVLGNLKALASGKATDSQKDALFEELKNLGTGLAIAGGVAAAALAAPHVVAFISKSVITKAVLGKGGSVPLLGTAIAGLAAFTIGPSILDIRGDEMDNLRTSLQKVVEDGERIEASNRNGFPSGDTIALLRTMVDEVAFAEQRIKELGENNIKFRVSKEYKLDSEKVRSAREALLRRVLAVENLAATGVAALRPEQLLFDAGQF